MYAERQYNTEKITIAVVLYVLDAMSEKRCVFDRILQIGRRT